MNSLRSNFREGKSRRREHTRLWWVVLGLGIVVIICANLFSINIAGQWVITIILCVLMSIYWSLAYRNAHVSPDTKGDGIYYLGLLFTFAALVAALIKFAGVAPERNLIPLIANFGIALVTTIFGLAGRVGFAMGQESAGDITAGAVNALEDAVDKMKRQALRSGETLESLVGHLEESEKVWKSTLARISGTAEAVGDSCDDFTRITKDLAQGIGAFQEAANEITSSASRMTGPMHDVSKRIARLNDECDRFNEVLEQARQTLAALDGNHFTNGVADFERTIADTSTLVSQLRNPLEQTGRRISEFGEKAGVGSRAFMEFEAASRRIGQVGANLTNFSDALDRLEAALQVVAKNGEGASKGIADTGEAIENMRTATEKIAKPLHQAATDASQLTGNVADLREKTAGLGSDLSAAREAGKRIREDLEAVHAKRPGGRLFGWLRRRAKSD